ncbi:MAG: hypothetical protein ACYCZO_13830, partial [Daejeonella sp.]
QLYILMKILFTIYLSLVLGITLFAQDKKTNLSYVDPTIGSVGVILEPARPTVHLPNSMLRVYPMKKDQLDDQISNFPLNVASHRIAWTFSFLPLSGNNIAELWNKPDKSWGTGIKNVPPSSIDLDPAFYNESSF